MSSSMHRALLGIEELESRQLLSVTVNPARINQKTLNHGNGIMTVKIISDTEAAANLLSSGAPLLFNVVDSTGTAIAVGTPAKVQFKDFNKDGIMDQMLKFRRSNLAGLAAGEYQFQAGNDDASLTEVGLFEVFTPGRRP